LKTKCASGHHTFRKLLCLAAGLLLVLAPLAALADTYRTLQEGMSGEDVVALKLRMFELGYFTSKNVSDAYNSLMAKRIAWLQLRNGLEETGVATPELQTLIYSDAAIPAEDVPATPAPTPAPLPIVWAQAEADLPQPAEDGFLPPGTDSAYAFKNQDEGHYIYLSSDLFVEITRHTDADLTLVWCETEVKLKNGEKLNTYLTKKGSKHYAFSTPEEMAADNQAVVAFTDDFFNSRLYNDQIPGIVVRNGEIIADKTYKTREAWPPLDTLAVFSDGSMKTFLKNEHTAQEYLELGAEQVFAFGPILVQNGEMGERIQDPTYYHYREPRCALGMIAPNHYIVLTVSGRTDAAKGAYLTWLAERMMALGVTEALNLDGGGTIGLIFMGENVFAGCTGKTTVREISSIFGFGRYPETGE
jgi:hypothetical protein